MKKSNKIVVTSALVGLLSVGGVSSYSFADTSQNPVSTPTSEVSIEPNAIKPGTWVKAGYQVLKYATNTWLFHREATETIYDYAITISSGNVGFNNHNSSGYGASTKHTVYINGIGQMFDTWPETSLLNWLDKLSVIITDESNGQDVVSKTATHEQHVYYTASHHGNYTVRWVDEAKMNWDLWLTVWDAEYGGMSAKDASLKQPSNGQVHTLKNVDGEEKEAKSYNGTFYFIPSENHKSNEQYDANKSLSIIDLQDQLYDNELGQEVKQFKNYNPGDKLTVEDTIKTVEYEPENNRTVFGFEAKDEQELRWAFDGDLTKEYSEGDNLKLDLTVVNTVDEFESLDYLEKARSNDKAPVLEDYLVK